MNRYLFRSLVAVLTFLLSIAVSAIIHPFGSKRWEHRYSNYAYHERHCPRAMAFARPALSIDAVATDPVKLLYSETRPQPYSSQQQITFLLDIQTTEPVSAVVVQHSSRWPEKDRWEVESVRVPYDPTRDAPPTVSLHCGSDQTLWVWISSIEFKDGARWVNPRHSGEQAF
jgi:hypothetical protein